MGNQRERKGSRSRTDKATVWDTGMPPVLRRSSEQPVTVPGGMRKTRVAPIKGQRSGEFNGLNIPFTTSIDANLLSSCPACLAVVLVAPSSLLPALPVSSLSHLFTHLLVGFFASLAQDAVDAAADAMVGDGDGGRARSAGEDSVRVSATRDEKKSENLQPLSLREDGNHVSCTVLHKFD
eukprot:763485-Hanusia_phi.AAC.1